MIYKKQSKAHWYLPAYFEILNLTINIIILKLLTSAFNVLICEAV